MVGTGTSISGHTQASTTTLSSWAMRFRNRIAETTSSATKQDNSANEAWAQRRVLDPACSFSQRQHPPGWKDSDPQPPFPEPNNGGSRRFFRDTRHAHISLPTTAAKSGRERARERAAHHTRPTRPPGETAVLFTLKHAERSEEVHRDPSFCRLPTVKIYSCPLMPRGGACRMKKWVPPCQKACHAAQTLLRHESAFNLEACFSHLGRARLKERHCLLVLVTVRFWASVPGGTSPSHQRLQNTEEMHSSPQRVGRWTPFKIMSSPIFTNKGKSTGSSTICLFIETLA